MAEEYFRDKVVGLETLADLKKALGRCVRIIFKDNQGSVEGRISHFIYPPLHFHAGEIVLDKAGSLFRVRLTDIQGYVPLVEAVDDDTCHVKEASREPCGELLRPLASALDVNKVLYQNVFLVLARPEGESKSRSLQGRVVGWKGPEGGTDATLVIEAAGKKLSVPLEQIRGYFTLKGAEHVEGH